MRYTGDTQSSAAHRVGRPGDVTAAKRELKRNSGGRAAKARSILRPRTMKTRVEREWLLLQQFIRTGRPRGDEQQIPAMA
jgi:hypothetical protein